MVSVKVCPSVRTRALTHLLNTPTKNRAEWLLEAVWVLSPKPADYTVVDYKDEGEDDLEM